MKFIAKTKCPACNKIHVFNLSKSSFEGIEMTKCECDFEYENIINLVSCEIDEENWIIERLSNFTTEQLKNEIKRREMANINLGGKQHGVYSKNSMS